MPADQSAAAPAQYRRPHRLRLRHQSRVIHVARVNLHKSGWTPFCVLRDTSVRAPVHADQGLKRPSAELADPSALWPCPTPQVQKYAFFVIYCVATSCGATAASHFSCWTAPTPPLYAVASVSCLCVGQSQRDTMLRRVNLHSKVIGCAVTAWQYLQTRAAKSTDRAVSRPTYSCHSIASLGTY